MSEIEDLLSQIRQDVADVREKGQQVIGAAALDEYLAGLQETASLTQAERDRDHASRLEHYKAQNATNLAGYAASVQLHAEMAKAAITYGLEALKAAMVINGAAAVAVLGFLSAAATKIPPPTTMLAYLPLALVFFAGGALVAAFAIGITYLSQASFAEQQQREGEVIRMVAIGLVVLSYIAFAIGALLAYSAFR